jgi:hypothetical protein
MDEAGRVVTGYTLVEVEVQTMVDEDPWVMTTIRGVDVILGEWARAVAIAAISLVYHTESDRLERGCRKRRE